MKRDLIMESLRAGVQQALRQGAQGAKMTWGRSQTIGCSFENGRLKETGGAEHAGWQVDVLRNGRLGSATGNIPEQMDARVEQALTLARVGGVAHFEAWPAPAESAQAPAQTAATRDLPRERLMESCAEMAATLQAYNPDLYILCSASRENSERRLATSGGVEHASGKTVWGLHVHAQRTEDSGMLFAGHGRIGCALDARFNAREIAEHVLLDLRRAERDASIPQGRTAAFLPPEILPKLLAPVAMGINGRHVAKGDSPLAGWLGRRILADNLTIEDTPHTPLTPQTEVMDADGIPSRNQALVTRGVLERFLYDLDSAGLAGAEPTGNSHCAPYRPILHPGSMPSDQLLKSIDTGLYVKSLIGYGQSNLINGDFSCNVGLGYRIEKGEIVGRVKNTMIAGNIYDLFRDQVTLSSDTGDDGRFPCAIVEGLHVSAS